MFATSPGPGSASRMHPRPTPAANAYQQLPARSPRSPARICRAAAGAALLRFRAQLVLASSHRRQVRPAIIQEPDEVHAVVNLDHLAGVSLARTRPREPYLVAYRDPLRFSHRSPSGCAGTWRRRRPRSRRTDICTGARTACNVSRFAFPRLPGPPSSRPRRRSPRTCGGRETAARVLSTVRQLLW